MSFLETITLTDVLCRQAWTTKQKDWLHEIEQTVKYDCNFHDFLSDILLDSNLCFQVLKNSSPQVTDGLKQFSDLHLWVKLKHFSFLCLARNWRHLGSEQPHQGTKRTVSRHTQKPWRILGSSNSYR